MKKKRFMAGLNITIVVFMLVVVLSGFTIAGKGDKPGSSNRKDRYRGKVPKYIFLFIGDGVGIPQINSTELYLTANRGGSSSGSIEKLNMSRLPAQGLTTTNASDSFITDSAASATALATGRKTASGVIGMSPDKADNYELITEVLKRKGYKIGIVSSVSIDHATPAAFYAHEPTRKNYYEIGLQLVNSDFDYFGGGGIKGNKESKRDGRAELYSIAEEKGFKVVNNRADFMNLKAEGSRVIAYDQYIDRDYALPYELDRREDSLSLADFTAKGIELLDNKKGFFMMVEGGKIDWACHANDAASAINDTIAFDKAIGKALEFYSKHPKETLIIVTGDHECGGMALGFSGTKYNTFFDKIKYQKHSYNEFSAALKRELEAGAKRLDELVPLIEDSFGLTFKNKGNEEMLLTDYELSLLKKAFQRTLNGGGDKNSSEDYLLYGGYDPLTVTLTHILNNKAGIAWTSYSHTAVPVPTFALGLGEGLFDGYYDNTDIHKKIKTIMKL